MKDKFNFYLDVYRKLGKTSFTIIDSFLNRDLKCLKVYRKANYYSKKNNILFKIYSFKLKKISNKFSFNVPPSTNIGKGLFIGHNGSIIINSKSVIGDNCNIATGTVIGAENRGIRKGCPKIGNKVWIGSNAVIVGNINIGDNVLIAPNSYINFDVPSNSIVIGNPGKIYKSINATEEYCTNLIEDLK